MPQFKYYAQDEKGRPVTGTLEEASAYRVVLALIAQGLRVTSVEAAAKRRPVLPWRRALTAQDLALLNEELLTIAESGLPLPAALEEIGRDLKNPRLRAVIEDVRKSIETGASFEEALGRHTESFSPVYVSLIRAGERTGNLSGVLTQLCTYSRRLVEMRHAVHELLAYPLFLLAALVSMITFLSLKIIPVFEDMFAGMGGRLPVPTRICLTVSLVVQSEWRDFVLWTAIGLLTLYVVFKVAGVNRRARVFLQCAGDRIRTWIPVLGPLYSAIWMERYARVLGLLLSSKVEAPESVILASAATGSALFLRAGFEAARWVTRGDTLLTAMAASGLFRSSHLWILRQAEQHGTLDSALLRLAESCERETVRRKRLIMMFVGPMFVILMGLVVGFTVIAMFMPVLMLSSLVN